MSTYYDFFLIFFFFKLNVPSIPRIRRTQRTQCMPPFRMVYHKNAPKKHIPTLRKFQTYAAKVKQKEDTCKRTKRMQRMQNVRKSYATDFFGKKLFRKNPDMLKKSKVSRSLPRNVEQTQRNARKNGKIKHN